MFDDLDDTLETILNDAAAPIELRNAAVSFETPDRNFTPAQTTVNLFLFEVKENRELRDPVPITELVAGNFIRRRPPLRVDCMYLVTAWSNQMGAARIAVEHQLLAQALLWLSRFPTVPEAFLQGSLAGQPFPPPTLVAQMNSEKNMGEFWTALGNPPRPGFYLVVTIAMDLAAQVSEGPPVVTKEVRLKRKMPPGVVEPLLATVLEIGGTVRQVGTLTAIPSAQVTLLELERVATTDEEGHFRFDNVAAGNYTLRTTAAGFTTLDKPIVIPGPTLNAYDIGLTP
jgi:uncharacterized protein DUF4255/carboxypeptidase family protein